MSEMAESVQRSLGRLEGKLEGFIISHAEEMQRINTKLHDNRIYLEGEVHKALNSHSEIKEDIKNLKDKTFHCPINDLKLEVADLKKSTARERFLEANPEIEKGRNLWTLAKTIGIIIAAALVITDLILNLKEVWK